MLTQRRVPVRARRPPRAVIFRRRAIVFGIVPAVIGLSIYLATANSPAPPTTTPRPNATGHAPTKSPSIEVGLRSETFVDHSRSTYNYTTGKTAPGRTLEVEVRYPTLYGSASPTKETTGAPVDHHATYPLIVFAPGFRLQPNDYSLLLDAWVRAGFVVAAVDFPDTTYPASEAPFTTGLAHNSPEGDIYSEPADVAFVLEQLIAANASRTSWLHRLLNPSEVALAGHSDGASVVASLAYDANYAEPKLSIHAVAALSGGEFAISGQSYDQPSRGAVPLLVVQSATDLCAAPWQAVKLYDTIGEPKYFLELNQASHLGAYNGADAAATAVVVRVSTAFFEAELDRGGRGTTQVLQTGDATHVSAITDAPLAAAIPTPVGASQCPHG